MGFRTSVGPTTGSGGMAPGEWITLTEGEKEAKAVSSRVETKPADGRPKGGVCAAVRELGVERIHNRHRVYRGTNTMFVRAK
jgi:hypothetical protein